MVAMAVVLDGPAAVVLDAESYWQYGQSVAGGDLWLEQHDIAYRTPGYPWLIGLCQFIAGPKALLLLIAIQAAMCVSLVPLCAFIAYHLVGDDRGRVASNAVAIITATGISRYYFARAVLGESLFVFLLMAHVACVVGLWKKPSNWRWAVAGGLVLGTTILVRPVAQWLWVAHFFLFFPILLTKRTDQADDDAEHHFPRRTVSLLALMAIVTGLLLAPWCIRNATMFGRPFVTEFVGRNIWIVTFQDQAGAGLPLPTTPEAKRLRQLVLIAHPEANLSNTWDVSNALVKSGMADDKADHLMKSVAAQAIGSDLRTWLERFVRRTVNFFRCIADEPPTFTSEAELPKSQDWWRYPNWLETYLRRLRFAPNLFANMAVSLGLFLSWITLVLSRKDWWIGWWLGAMIGYFAFVTAAIEIPAYRYRLVAEPLMGIVGGLGISSLLSFRSKIPCESP